MTSTFRMAVWVALFAVGCGDDLKPAADAAVPDAMIPTGNLAVVGHSDLRARGMNSAPAILGDHLYVGSRTDGVNHDDAGILIVDISDPTDPAVVGEIGPPEQALETMTSRELRAIPHKQQLVVLNFACGDIHGCDGFGSEPTNIKIYDVSDPVAPQLLGTQTFGNIIFPSGPHEFYLWVDPADQNRVLLFNSTPLGPPSFEVLDITDPAAMVVAYQWDHINDSDINELRNGDTLVHSVSVTDDGATAFFSAQGAGFFLVDMTDVAAGRVPADISLLTPADQRILRAPPGPPAVHSATPIPGRDLVVVTDEVYPAPAFPGCPWGWARIVDYSDPANLVVTAELKHEQNERECDADNGPIDVSFTAHNTTNTESLSFITWHSAGLLVYETTNPSAPTRVAEFSPDPIAAVATEDPTLGGNPVLMWSYPILRDGLIYVVDIRNGLYVLEYTGFADNEVLAAGFREGNSNIR